MVSLGQKFLGLTRWLEDWSTAYVKEELSLLNLEKAEEGF